MPRSLRRALTALAALALGLSGAVVVALPAAGAEMTPVINTADDNSPGTLRYAVNEANTTPGPDTIVVPSGLLVLLDDALGPLILQEGVEIVAQNGPLVVWRDGSFDFFQILPNASTFQDYIFTNVEIDGRSGMGQNHRAIVVNSTNPTSLALNNVDFHHLTAEIGGGGAILIDGLNGALTVDGSEFYNNVAPTSGGAISLTGGSFESTASSYHDNSASTGGALEINSSGSFSSEGDAFTDNHATGGPAGGVYIVSCTGEVEFQSTTATGNDSAFDGGFGFALSTSGNLTIQDGRFTGNEAQEAGGVFWIDEVAGVLPGVSITDSIFSANTSDDDGGAIWINDNTQSLGTFTDLTFDGNASDGNGGALYVDEFAGPLTITASEFLDNEAIDGNGGAVFIFDLPPSSASGWVDTTFSGNKANLDGGGIGGAAAIFELHGTLYTLDSTYSGNTVGSDGSSVAIATIFAPGNAHFVQSTFDEPGTDEYAIAIDTITNGDGDAQGGVELSHATVVAPGVLKVLHAEEDATGFLSVYFTIADGIAAVPALTSPDGREIDVTWSLVSTSLTPELDPDESVFNVADMKLGPLQNNGGITQTRLPLPGSPAIDSGDPDIFVNPNDDDQRGEGFPRLVNGVLDIGAVEAALTLPATGSTIPLWIPIAGGAILLVGAAAIAFTIISRRKLHAAESAVTPPNNPAD